MPQLDILGYSAELFWVVLAFGALYIYSLCFVLPRIAQNLLYRQITFNTLVGHKKTINKSEAPRLAASIENTFGNVAIDMINIRKTIDPQTSFVYTIVDSLEESVIDKK